MTQIQVNKGMMMIKMVRNIPKTQMSTFASRACLVLRPCRCRSWSRLTTKRIACQRC